jgi:hypothetical protein
MCKQNREFEGHLLLHCEVAGALWDVFFNQFGLSWVLPSVSVDCRYRSKCCCVEDGACVPIVVSMEGKE